MTDDKVSVRETIKALWPCVWTHNTILGKIRVIIAVLFILLSITLNLSVPLFLKEAVTVLAGDKPFIQMAPLLLIITYAVIWGTSRIFVSLSQIVAFSVEVDGAKRFCLQLFNHIHRLSSRYHSNRKLGELTSIVERSRNIAIDLIGRPFIMLLPVIIEIIVAMVILSTFYDIRFGIVLLGMLIAYLLLNRYVSQWIVKCRKKQNIADGQSNAYIVESLLHFDVVKYSNAQKHVGDKALSLLQEKERADTVALNADAKIHLCQNIIIGLCVTVMTIMAGIEVIHARLDVGDFVLIHGYLLMFMVPLSVLGYHMRCARDDLAHFKAALDILKAPVEIKDEAGAAPLECKSAKISFEQVNFSYDQKKVIDDVSFTVMPGTTVAIVGPSGSGKSTLAKLLCRFFEVEDGNILIDDQNIRNVTKHSLRSCIGVVPQDTKLFNDTLRNNIKYNKPGCSEQEVARAIRGAHLEKYIAMLPNGLDTMVGERGIKLSGGEKQRVAIARLIIKNPDIMIFDEATSALDLQTENEIQKCLNEISTSKTTIIIAHRLSTIKHADEIMVLDKGRIVEVGDHKSLLKMKGIYGELWAAQKHNDNRIQPNDK